MNDKAGKTTHGAEPDRDVGSTGERPSATQHEALTSINAHDYVDADGTYLLLFFTCGFVVMICFVIFASSGPRLLASFKTHGLDGTVHKYMSKYMGS